MNNIETSVQQLRRKKKRRKFFYYIRLLVFSVCYMLLFSMGFYTYLENHKYAEDINLDIQLKKDVEFVQEQQPQAVKIDDENLLRRIDFDALHAINTDIFGWLYIPDTNVDYPTLQEQTVGETFYLNHDYDKSYSQNGSILTPKEPMDLEDAHLLLFGHHMRDKSVMFSSLPSLYSDEMYGKEHFYMYMYYPDRAERWILWTAVDSQSDDMVYTIPYTIGSDDYQNLLDNIDIIKKYSVSKKPDKQTKTVVLSTCNGRQAGSPVRFYLVYRPDKVYYYDTESLESM